MDEWLQFDDPVMCTIRRVIEGHFDEASGQWVDGGEQEVAFTAEIQPKTGSRRASEAGTRYESSHWMQAPPDADVRPGDLLEAAGRRYQVIHVADWGTHLEADLEAMA